jgi:hypothetical protein
VILADRAERSQRVALDRKTPHAEHQRSP